MWTTMTDNLFPDLQPDEKPCEGLWGAKRAKTFDGAEYDEERKEKEERDASKDSDTKG